MSPWGEVVVVAQPADVRVGPRGHRQSGRCTSEHRDALSNARPNVYDPLGRHRSRVERSDPRDYRPFNLAWSRSTRCRSSSTAVNARTRCFSDNAATST